MADYSRFDATEIKTWTSKVFERLGAPADDARMTTDALIHADLMGIDSHGLNRATNQNYFGGLKSSFELSAMSQVITLPVYVAMRPMMAMSVLLAI